MVRGRRSRNARLEPPAAGVQAPASASDADRRHWRSGLRDFQRGQFARALDAWRRCRVPGTEPAQAEALFRLALQGKTPGEAVARLQEAVRLAPGDAVYHYHLALSLWRARQGARALGELDVAAQLAGPALGTRIAEQRAVMRLWAGQAEAPEAPAAAALDAGASDSWRAQLAGALAQGGGLPEPTPGMAPGLTALLAGCRALAGGQSQEAAARAEAALASADLPADGRALAEWMHVEAQASLGHWRAVLGAEAPPGALGDRLRAWKRFGAATIWTRAVASGDAASAAAVLPRLGDAPGLPAALRRRGAAAMGAAAAARGNWESAVRHWGAAGSPEALAQPLALANERLGRTAEAGAQWRRVWAAVRRGQLPPSVAGFPRGVVGGLVAARAGELLARSRDYDAVMALVAQALADPGTELPGAFCLKVAKLYDSAYEEPCPQWAQMEELLLRGLREAPDELWAWTALASLRRRAGRPAEALEADRRAVALAPGESGPAEWWVEDTGCAMLQAWAAGDLEAAERLTATLALPAVSLPPEVAPQAAMLADLATAVWERARHRPHPRPISRWDRALRRGAPWEGVPAAAYMFRGLLSLLGGHENAADAFFDRLAHYWEDAAPGNLLACAAYMRWIGFAHCWVRGVRGQWPCADGCPKVFLWLASAEGALALLDGPAPPTPPAPPPAVADCATLTKQYAVWVPLADRLRAHLGEAALDVGAWGRNPMDAMNAVIGEMVRTLGWDGQDPPPPERKGGAGRGR